MQAQKPDRAQHDIHDHALIVRFKDILQAQRAISREIEVGRLIDTLLTIAIDLVSAERGLLFLARGREPEVEAEATTQDGSVRVSFPPASAASPRFSQTVLRYVVRMEKSLVLDDAVAKNQFSDDDYLRGGSICSILCLPLIAQRNLVGVLYLENALAPHAFTPEKLAGLELLALQAAVSLRTAALCVDLTHEMKERRKADAELERFHHMYGEAHLNGRDELIRGMTAALAHELNQPLGAVQSNAQAARRLLSASKPDLVEVKAALDDIIRDTSRTVETVQSVRAIFQRHAVEMTAIDLSQLLHDVSQIVSADAALQKIIVRLELPASLPPALGSRAQLIQALMNLIVNAFEAIDHNNDHVREVAISARQHTPGRVHIAVRDSGKGIDPETMPRLFDAFFTTKPKGMGMGLAIVNSIIENHGGQLCVTRNTDRGMTIEFDLPISADP